MLQGALEVLERRALLAGNAAIDWNTAALDAVRAALTPPPYAARNLAMVHAAVFDAVNAVEGRYKPYRVRAGAPDWASAEAAASAAAHGVLVALYPARQGAFAAALAESLKGIPDGRGERAGVALGEKVARKMIAGRRDDGADEVVEYVPGTDVDDWQPTPPGFAGALFPQWPDVAPFAIQKGSDFRPDSPPEITSEAFAASMNQVKELGAADSTARTARQTDTALLWADGAGTATPPGHWNRIASSIAEERDLSLVESARMLALLNIAMADAGIVSWDAKYAYELCRPITAIRNAANDGNPLTEPDADWTPLIVTPPFPSYTSGHSTFSSAAATVLAGFFGTDRVTFTTTSEGTPTVITRTFDSFWEAAEDAGISRIYGGIHYDFDNVEGLASGSQVGELVVKRLMRPRGGHGPGVHLERRHDRNEDREGNQEREGDDLFASVNEDVTA
jgi:hypothetical protein